VGGISKLKGEIPKFHEIVCTNGTINIKGNSLGIFKGTINKCRAIDFNFAHHLKNGDDMLLEHVDRLIGVEAGRLLGDSDRGTKAKNITSCDNAFVTNIVLAQAAHRTPPGSFALCESEATATTKRPAGSEINPTIRYRKIA